MSARPLPPAPRWASPKIWAPVAVGLVVVTFATIWISVENAPRIPYYANARRTQAVANGELAAGAGDTEVVKGFVLRYEFEVDGVVYVASGVRSWGSAEEARTRARSEPPITAMAVYVPTDPRVSYVDDRSAFGG